MIPEKQKKTERWNKIKNSYSWLHDIDYRLMPDKYKIGKGEQGVLICQPYKGELLPYWRFKNPSIAKESSDKIFEIFQYYLEENDFIGADMARKFLQMGYTRARRYANHPSGRKYDAESGQELPRSTDNLLKAESASIFYVRWKEAEENLLYKQWKQDWKKKYG